MSNKIDQLLTNFGVYLEATNWLGVVDVELPSFEALTETIKGAGISGEVNAPVKGHYGSQTLKINWKTITPESAQLTEPKVHAIDFRGNQQLFDPAKGYIDQPAVVKVRCVPTNFSLGKFAVAASTETSNEFEVHYIKVVVGEKVLIEYDKFNAICVINGKDIMATVRKNIGR